MTTLNPYYPGKMAALRMEGPKPLNTREILAAWRAGDRLDAGETRDLPGVGVVKNCNDGPVWIGYDRGASDAADAMAYALGAAKMPLHLDYAGFRSAQNAYADLVGHSAKMAAQEYAGEPVEYPPASPWPMRVIVGGCCVFWACVTALAGHFLGWW